jgi:dihydrofolate reductase
MAHGNGERSPMSKVVFGTSMSLDGFMTASDRSAEEPLGAGGERLHAWIMESDDERDREMIEKGSAGVAAMICGRRTYEDSLPWWGANGPGGDARTPVFVVTHEAPAESPENGVYTFVTDGIEDALEQAKAVAGEKIISTGGGSIGRQLLEAGLVDELQIHLAPVLFGAGISTFAGLADRHIELEPIEVVHTAAAIHMRFRVVRG